MPIFQSTPGDDAAGDAGYLESYRSTVERLRRETEVELGSQPMTPETASMIALLLASLPMLMLLLPSVPFELREWQVGFAQFAVWLGAFQIQRLRYDRFESHWRRKVVAYSEGLRAQR